MPGLDTNVLVRWLVQDDERQSNRAYALFESARTGRFTLFVPSTVTLELEWVLRSRYQFDKTTVLGAFNALLETQEIEFQDEAALERALHLYRRVAADFADCLHAGACAMLARAPLLTFDAKAAHLANVELLSTD
jgi:predicted nucleic-acid-binding protein